jgi:two-component system CheB/CheR fusion protein
MGEHKPDGKGPSKRSATGKTVAASRAGPATSPDNQAPVPGGDGNALPEPEAAPDAPADDTAAFPVVGIGASAGGLDAIERFLGAMSPESESALAIVIVQHLDPERKSLLTDLIQRHTRMSAVEAAHGARVEPGVIYVIPPNRDLAIDGGKLQLVEPAHPRGSRPTIDFFFRSLANDRREKAVAVILSGSGTDGTLGLRAVKEAGGLVLAQQPETAQYDSMPRSALGTGLVDFALPPEEMPERIRSYLQRSIGKLAPGDVKMAPDDAQTSAPLQRIFSLLRSYARHDFSRYKRTTILRRVERRMAVHQLETIEAYVRLLQGDSGEVAILFRELLIGVTNFFRDPDAFASLQGRVIPALLDGKRTGDSLRVWAPGCSTGEEAFSIAILIQEQLSQSRLDVRAQIFATDIDPDAISHARVAVYPSGIAADVSPERLARFFAEENGAYRVKKVIRDMVVFAEQNVADDPPFSRMDLISCRNLLIYMNGDLQRRVLPLFHYALNPMGYLFLGSSESVGEFSDLFSPVDRKWKIFTRKPGLLPQRASVDFARASLPQEPASRRSRAESRREATLDVRQALEQALLTQHTPAAVVINSEGDVLYIHGRTGYYLEPAPGEASLNVLRMAREGLRLELTTALRKAGAMREPVIHRGVTVRANGAPQIINLTVAPLNAGSQLTGLYLIVFEPVQSPIRLDDLPRPDAAGDKDQRITQLERELRSKEEYLQTAIEELETSNEELTSTNEELQSANEELQSTNEELETSKEELQSVNEELMTVNIELQKKLEELSRVNNDLNNLLASTGIGTVFVDHMLRIQRFTPAATDIINLIQTDIGRPVAHIVSNLAGYTDLIKDVTGVLDSLIPKEREVQVRNGRWYLMRIQPYRTLDNVIEGAVITFVDLTARRQILASLDEAHRLRVESLAEPVIIFSLSSRVLEFSRLAFDLLGYTADEVSALRATDLLAAESLGAFREALDQAERGHKPSQALTFRRKDGVQVGAEARFERVDGGTYSSIFVVLHGSERSDRAI